MRNLKLFSVLDSFKSEVEKMDYLVDCIYEDKPISKTDLKKGCILCNDWIECHVRSYWENYHENNDNPEVKAEILDDLIITTTLKLDLEMRLEK